MSGSQHHEIVVAGGGHAGLFAALALVQAGFEDVVVVDPAGPGALAPTGRSLALLAGSKAILERHGVWKLVRDRGHPVWRVDVAGAGAGRVIYDAAEIGVEALAWGFVNERLRDGLASAWSRLRGPAGWLTGSVIAMEAGNPRRLVLEEGTLKADLVIAADGRNSALRRMAGIGSSRRTYDQAALSFVVEHEHDNRATVLERLRPSGPVATLPLGARRTGITWVDRRARCEALGANEGEALMADLHADD